MSNPSASLINKLWNYCSILRDDGLSYGDYVEQLTFLLFLKMAHERTQPPWNHPPVIPEDYSWPTLVELDGIPLEYHYRTTLENLSKEPGMFLPPPVASLSKAPGLAAEHGPRSRQHRSAQSKAL